MGEQFVTGETIDEALRTPVAREARGLPLFLRHAGRSRDDRRRRRALPRAPTRQAIHAIGRASAGRGIYDGPGISIKLSALHPRYSRAQRARVLNELYPRLRELALLAHRYDIGINIDAEEADRLEISLDLLERLCHEPALAGWNGIGFVVQAYQKRCAVRARLCHRSGAPLAATGSWSASSRAPIGTRRSSARRSTAWPTFRSTRARCTPTCRTWPARASCWPRRTRSTRNSRRTTRTPSPRSTTRPGPTSAPGSTSSSACTAWASRCTSTSWRATVTGLARPCRIYAPVGTHETLLAYLVRRLLENGANSSFVNRIADEDVPIDELVADPVTVIEQQARAEGVAGLAASADRAAARRCSATHAATRSAWISPTNAQLAELVPVLQASVERPWRAEPGIDGTPSEARAATADGAQSGRPRDVVGTVIEATPEMWTPRSARRRRRCRDGRVAARRSVPHCWSARPTRWKRRCRS